MSVQVGDILRVVAILSWLDGDIMQNVFNAVIGGSGGPFTEGDIVADALEWVSDMYGTLPTTQASTCDGSEVRVYIYDSIDDDWDEIGSTAWTYNPTGTTDELPRGVAMLINAKTIEPDVNGKKFLGGPVEANVTLGLLTAGVLTNLANFADEWTDLFTGGTSGASWVPGIWSPTRTNLFPMSGSYLIPTICAYQRRRKRGVGI